MDSDDELWYDCEELLEGDGASTATGVEAAQSQLMMERQQSGSLASKAYGSRYAGHIAAFHRDASGLREWLAATPKQDWTLHDPLGNTVLHVAVLRRSADCIAACLDEGFPLDARNAAGWEALEEALALEDASLVKPLYVAKMAEAKAELRAKKQLLAASLAGMPDYQMQLKWDLGSAFFGLLLRKLAPRDTYTITKRGTQLRVDGTLMGISGAGGGNDADEGNGGGGGVLPQWKRGSFSLVVDAGVTPSTLLLLNHGRRTYVDLGMERKREAARAEGKGDDEAVQLLIREGAAKTKFKTKDVRFKPARGWLGGDVVERVEGWQTKVYEVTGKLAAISYKRAPLRISDDATWEDYLAMVPAVDDVSELANDLITLAMEGGASAHNGKAGGKSRAQRSDTHDSAASTSSRQDKEKAPGKHAPRKFSCKCWMAEDFPMSLQQLMPLLDVIGNANKHIGKVGRFLHKYGDMRLFPVRIQIPLLFTVYIVVTTSQFQALHPGDPATKDDWYQVPPGYTRKSIDEIGKSSKKSKRCDQASDGTVNVIA